MALQDDKSDGSRTSPQEGATPARLPASRRRWRRSAAVLLLALALGFMALAMWWRTPRSLRFPDYRLDVRIPPAGAPAPAPLRAGFGSIDITPEVSPKAPVVYLSGFHHPREALGIHDPLYARAAVFDDGRIRVGLVALDLIGIHNDDVILVRRALPTSLGLDYLAVSCTHNHEGPDTLGLWGPSLLRTGVDPAYLARVRDGAIDAVRQAVADLRPTRLTAGEVDTSEDDLIRDSRPPRVIDARLLALRFEDAGAPQGSSARASVIVWSNHPECLADGNRLVSSDFPSYVRRAVERDGGGMCLYFSGSVGGLMTPLGQAIRGLDGRTYLDDTFEKAEAMGEVLSKRAREALEAPGARHATTVPLAVRAHQLDIEAENRLYWAAMKLHVIDRGLAARAAVRTEVGALRIGPVALLLVPGELYPEIAIGGVESPEFADYPGDPLERPPLRELLARALPEGGFGAIVGLANDEIGYIIPRTQWDARAPYTYGQTSAPYGEANSIGPNAAPALHQALSGVIAELPQ